MPNSTKKSNKKSKLRNSEYYDMQKTFDSLYAQSVNGKNFTKLMEIITCDENIKLAYRNIKRNTGSKTAGVDGRTIQDIARLSETEFIRYAKNKFNDYKPKAVRRVEIPKPNGKTRPLGIPAIWDRVVQQCVLQVLEPICEAKFSERSHGFRPNRSVENAMAQSYKLMQQNKLHYVVDVDIKGFFDNVDHGKLLKQMWSLGIRDKNLICIVSKMLKAKIKLPTGEIIENPKGTPQGGILSPLLSNIVLNEFDWWIASQWELIPTHTNINETVKVKGELRIGRSYKYRVLRNTNLKECFSVRYADDFKIFCKDSKSAYKMYHAVQLWLRDRLGLETSSEKSKIANLKRDYSEFLGFKMKVIKKSNKWIVKSHICDKALKRTEETLKKTLREIEHPKGSNDETRKIAEYNSKVIGIHQYFRTATMVSEDLAKVAYSVKGIMKNNKLGKRVKKTGKALSKFIEKEYGKSKQLRYIRRTPILPIAYIKHKNPMMKKSIVNQYTSEGRAYIHRHLQNVDVGILRDLMRNPIEQRSVEYNDNRIALYSAQNGKCSVTKQMLTVYNTHCHHKIPLKYGGEDNYQNLTLVTNDIHTLIHAVEPLTIHKYIELVKDNKEYLNKLNRLRTLAKLETISNH